MMLTEIERFKWVMKSAIIFTSGKIVILTNMLFVPDMNRNLVSKNILGKSDIKNVYKFGKLVLSL